MAKTKQTYMKAVFTKRNDGARGSESTHVLIREYQLIDKKTERTVITCRTYSKGRGETVHCAFWLHRMTEKAKPAEWEWGETSGRGQAGGYGYHKSSAAVADAIRNAGIDLYGSPYGHPVNGDTPAQTKKLLKTHAHIGGCGNGSIETALSAIAYAAGFTDCIFVR